jgi:hypothetical protein
MIVKKQFFLFTLLSEYVENVLFGPRDFEKIRQPLILRKISVD